MEPLLASELYFRMRWTEAVVHLQRISRQMRGEVGIQKVQSFRGR